MYASVIDLGTNTFRLLIAVVDENGVTPIQSEDRIVRLGEGLVQAKRFSFSAMQRAMDCLASFKRTLCSYPIEHLSVIGTSAFRESENRDLFLREIKKSFGFDVEVMSGEEEARYAFVGANLVLRHREGPMLLIDIGGGSTEFVVAEGTTTCQTLSTPLGVVYLTEQYLHDDPPTLEECCALQEKIQKILCPVIPRFPSHPFFAGTAGTVTTLAAMDQEMRVYDPGKINRYRLSKGALDRLLKKVLSLPRKERCQIPGLQKGREDLIVSGLFILLAVMERGRYEFLTVSDYGLREGVLVECWRRGKERDAANLPGRGGGGSEINA